MVAATVKRNNDSNNNNNSSNNKKKSDSSDKVTICNDDTYKAGGDRGDDRGDIWWQWVTTTKYIISYTHIYIHIHRRLESAVDCWCCRL